MGREFASIPVLTTEEGSQLRLDDIADIRDGFEDTDQAMRLIVLPRWAVTSLRFLEVAMLLLFAAVLAAEILRKRWTLPGGLALGASRAAALFAAGLLMLGPGSSPPARRRPTGGRRRRRTAGRTRCARTG